MSCCGMVGPRSRSSVTMKGNAVKEHCRKAFLAILLIVKVDLPNPFQVLVVDRGHPRYGEVFKVVTTDVNQKTLRISTGVGKDKKKVFEVHDNQVVLYGHI